MNPLFVNFDDEPIPTTKYLKDKRPITFDHTTVEYYVSIREQKIDPLSFMEMGSCSTAFEFPYQWDSYTGDRLNKDPYGSLYFDPDVLVNIFYNKRLTLLWINETQDLATGTYYEGYYDGGVGSGSDLNIISRGPHPELYPFRIPITNCYLTNDHKSSVITMGPKLTDEEIKKIDELANQQGGNYQKIFRRKRPSIIKMKYFYDQAISKEPDISQLTTLEQASCMNENELTALRDKANRLAVDNLKTM